MVIALFHRNRFWAKDYAYCASQAEQFAEYAYLVFYKYELNQA